MNWKTSLLKKQSLKSDDTTLIIIVRNIDKGVFQSGLCHISLKSFKSIFSNLSLEIIITSVLILSFIFAMNLLSFL